MSIRRNFTHNCLVHPFCGILWTIGDTFGLLRLVRLRNTLIAFGERIHEKC